MLTIYRDGLQRNTLALVLFSLCGLFVYTPYNHIGIWIIIPLLMIYAVLKNGRLKNENVLTYVSIVLLSFLSCFFAGNVKVAFSSLFTILTGFVGFLCFFSLSGREKNLSMLFAIFLLYYLGMWWYIVSELGIANVDIATDRLGTEEGQLNANDVAYMTFYFNSALWMLYAFSERFSRKKVVGVLLLIGMVVLSFVAATLFASRQILLIELPFVLGLLYIKFFKGRSGGRLNKWLLPILAILILVVLYQYVGEAIFSNSLLFERYENIEEDSRLFLMWKALEVGIHNPILGVGCGNFMYYSGLHVFSHCSYTELFANSGFVAAFVYIYWIIRSIFIQIKRYRATKSVMFLYLALICFMWFLSNFFFVFYINVWLMGFWGLILGTSETLYRNEMNKRMVYA